MVVRQARPVARTQRVRVLRSEELPQPDVGTGAATRREALASTVPDPVFREVEVGGQPVLLTRLPSGQPVAFAAHCPHQGTPLHEASIYEGNLRCPRHNYVYDLHSGRNILPTRDARPGALARLRPGHLPTYRVEERDGWILVAEQPDPPAPGGTTRSAGTPRGTAPAPPAGDARRDARASRGTAPAPARGTTPGGSGSPTGTAGTPQPGPGTPTARAPPAGVLTVQAGQAFEVALPTRPRPSHLWRVACDSEAVEVTGQDFRRQPDGTVVHRILARAHHPGEASLNCSYSLPWAEQPAEVRRFTVTVIAAGNATAGSESQP